MFNASLRKLGFFFLFLFFARFPNLTTLQGAKETLELGITGPEGIEISRPEEVWSSGILLFKKNSIILCKDTCSVSSQLEAEATHRAITIGNRVSVCAKYPFENVSNKIRFLQANCPVYLVNVSSMAAGDEVATAKMQGGHLPSPPYRG